MPWTITFYSPRVEDEVLALASGFVARFLKYAERMEVYGPGLGMPHTKAMGGGLFELRIKAAQGSRGCFTAPWSIEKSSSSTNSLRRRTRLRLRSFKWPGNG